MACPMSYYCLGVMILLGILQPTVCLDCPRECYCKYYGSQHQLMVTCERMKLLDVPKGIPAETVELYLGHNLLSHIHNDAFSALSKLTSLSLKGNLLAILDDGAFRGLSNLRSLFLTENSLNAVNTEVFTPLVMLQNLYLTGNLLQSIPDLGNSIYLRKLNVDNNRLYNVSFPTGYRNLKAMKSIVLNNNPKITEIKKIDFAAFKDIPVAKLSMEQCGLKKIENGTFGVFLKLVSLSLGYNELPAQHVRYLIEGLAGSSITSLDLSGVITSGVLPADTFSALDGVPLQHLSLRHSEIDNLLGDTFKVFSDLQSLDLSFSRIDKAEPGTFTGLEKLEKLLLYHNRFKVFPTNLPRNCKYIDMSHNVLAVTDLGADVVSRLHFLEELYIHHCGLTTIAIGAFQSTVSLKKLDLSNNALPNSSIGATVFESLVKLEGLNLAHNRLQNFSKEHSIFSYLINLKTLDMSGNNCEKLPSESFNGLANLETLDLSKNKLAHEIAGQKNGELFKGLGKLVSLDISGNNIQELPSNSFDQLIKLETLHLENNDISHWKRELFANTKSLTALNMANNHISVINDSSLQLAERSLETLDLSNNPFSCYCSLVWFRNWINTTNITLTKLDSYTCSSPKNMVGKTVLSFKPLSIEQECNPPPWLLIAIVVPVTVFVIMCAAFTHGYRKRWRLRLWWYLRMQKKEVVHEGDQEAIINREDRFQHDCFVSVSDTDDDWVRDVLLPKMDNGHALPGWQNQEPLGGGRHSLCCASVHLIAGQEGAFTQIANAIHASRQVMIVLTREYLRQGQHMDFELGLALHKVSEQGWGSVILVILEPGADVRIPHGQLHELLNRGEELKWSEDPAGQEVFWNKLTDRLDADNHNQQ